MREVYCKDGTVAKRGDVRKFYYDMEPTYKRLVAKGIEGWPVESKKTRTFILKWAKEHKFKPDSKILEVGCGSGEIALALASHKDVHVEACDFAETAIGFCNEIKCPENLTFFQGNAMTHRGFPNPPYDWIIADQFLQGIIGGDRVFFLKRMRENLKINGKVLLSTMLGVPDTIKNKINLETRVNSNNTRYYADLSQFADELKKSRMKAVKHIKVNEYYRIFFLVRV